MPLSWLVVASVPSGVQFGRMYWINEAKQKYYRATIARDLIGQLGVLKEYGSLQTARGRRIFQPVSTVFDGNEEISKVDKTRLRRGYRVAIDPLESLIN